MSKDLEYYTVTIADWQYVLRTMRNNNRTNGFVDVIEKDGGMKLEFFDSNPYLMGAGALGVSIEEVISFTDKTLEILN